MSRRPDSRRRAAARFDGGRLVALMAVSFGLTVVLTRLYLISTGYPKIGGGTYHIAHALFGGLFLVVSSLLVLMYANRGVLTACAVLSGIGLGLFIDEVGKFITANNNYFFPLAAPLIYIAFLLMVLVARRAHRVRNGGSEAQLLEVLDALPLVLTRRLSCEERAAMRTNLAHVVEHAPAHAAELAALIEGYLRQSPPTLRTFESATVGRLKRGEELLFPRRVLRPLIVAVLGAHAVWSAGRLVLTAAIAAGWHTRFGALQHLLDTTDVHGWKSLVAWVCATAAEVAATALYGYATITMCRLGGGGSDGEGGRQDDRGVRVAIWATMLSLTVVNVLNSYFHQFVTIFTAIAEALLLFALLRYRSRFLHDPPTVDQSAPTGRVRS
jgi:hypothetical protein